MRKLGLILYGMLLGQGMVMGAKAILGPPTPSSQTTYVVSAVVYLILACGMLYLAEGRRKSSG